MEWLLDKLRTNGNQTAVIFKEKEYAYAQLADRIAEYDQVVSSQLHAGDIVAIISDYSFESIALFLALAQRRHIVVPITTKVEAEIEGGELPLPHLDRGGRRAEHPTGTPSGRDASLGAEAGGAASRGTHPVQ
jgi:hypothetical protein